MQSHPLPFMSESNITPFFIVACILICVGFSYLEVAWLRRTPQISLIWSTMVPVTAVNCLLFFVGMWVLSNPLAVLFFPFPIVPAIFILIKIGLYAIIKSKTGVELQSMWLVSSVVIVGACIFGSMLVS